MAPASRPALAVVALLALGSVAVACGENAPTAADTTTTTLPPAPTIGLDTTTATLPTTTGTIITVPPTVPPVPTTCNPCNVPTAEPPPSTNPDGSIITTTVPPASTLPRPADGKYTVQSGDTLALIAARFGVTQAALAAANGITDPNNITTGMKLTIPAPPPTTTTTTAPPPPTTTHAPTTYTVKAGDSLSSIAAKFGISQSVLAAANNITDPNKIYVGQVLKIPGH